MRQNIGTVDKIIRGVLGLFLIYIASVNYGSSAVISAIAFVAGLILILTSMFGFCLLYKSVGFSTKHEDKTSTPDQ